MATPVIDPRVDMFLTGDWLDITGDIRQSPPISVRGGLGNESSAISPSRCEFVVNNDSGDYNPRNPMGQYYGEIGKNTPVRVRVPLLLDNVPETDSDGWGAKWDNATSSGGSVVNTDWTRSGTTNSHSIPAANAFRRSWLKSNYQFQDSTVRTRFTLPTNDITGALVSTQIEFRVLDANNIIAVQYVFNSNETVALQISEVIGGVSRILSARDTIPGINVTTYQQYELAAMVEGAVVRGKIWPTGQPEPADWQMVCTRATVRYGRTGVATVVPTGNTNTKPFVCTYTNFAVEARPFVGEVSNYVPKVSNEAHTAPFVEITASGPTQRTEQGSQPFKSAMSRFFSSGRAWIREGALLSTTGTGDFNSLVGTDADAADIAGAGGFLRLQTPTLEGAVTKEDQLFEITSTSSSGGNTTVNFTPDAFETIKVGDVATTYRRAEPSDLPVAYWPCEDGNNATAVASGLVGGDSLLFANGVIPQFGAVSQSFPGSAPILKLNNAELTADIPNYDTSNGALTWHFLLEMPDVDEPATGQVLVEVYFTGGTAEVWALGYGVGGGDGDIIVAAFDTVGSTLFSTPYDMGARGNPRLITFVLEQTGPSTVTYSLVSTPIIGSEIGGSPVTGTVTAAGVSTLGKAINVRVNPLGGYVDVGLGHLAFLPAVYRFFNFIDPPVGYSVEQVFRRMQRTAYEEDIPFVYNQSNKVISGQMGPQEVETVLSVIGSGAERDLGRFYESRGAYSFEYRQRGTLYNQDPFLTVDYPTGGVVSELIPNDDDKDIRNDIVLSRPGGSFRQATKTEGRLSTQKPQDGGVGRYTESTNANTRTDAQLQPVAEWLLHLGTVDQERYPSIRLTPVASEIELAQLFSAGVGNRLVIENLSSRNVYEPIDQLVLGYAWTLHPYFPVLELNTESSLPYNVANLDSVRLDSDTTFLNENLDETETSIDVASTDGQLWITTALHPGEFPVDIMIGGERMTLTACTGTINAQTMIVVRSVNGVVKSHDAFVPVRLADPFYIAL